MIQIQVNLSTPCHKEMEVLDVINTDEENIEQDLEALNPKPIRRRQWFHLLYTNDGRFYRKFAVNKWSPNIITDLILDKLAEDDSTAE